MARSRRVSPATFQVTGLAANPIPAAAIAVTGNLTVTGQTAPGYLALTRSPRPSPATSTLNFPAGDTRANGVTVPLGPGGKLGVVYIGPCRRDRPGDLRRDRLLRARRLGCDLLPAHPQPPPRLAAQARPGDRRPQGRTSPARSR